MLKRLFLKIGLFAGIFLFLLLKPSSVKSASADILVISDSGSVDLIIDSTSKPVSESSQSNPLGLEVQAKEVNLVPERTESIVKVEPSKTDDKKVQVTVTQVPTTQATTQTTPAPSQPQAPHQNQTKTPSAPPVPIVKQVDQVVAQGKSGDAVLSVNPAAKDSSGKGQVSINQGSTTATTNLPVQINTVNHSVSVVSPQGTQKNLLVLPKEAVDDVVSKGLINSPIPVSPTFQETPALLVPDQSQQKTNPTTKPSPAGKPSSLIPSSPSSLPKTSVEILQNEPVYQISGDRNINLLNVVNFKIPINVQVSAKTGQVGNFTINFRKLFGF